MDESQKFGTKLRELRKKAGLTLKELADKVDVDFTYLSKIENEALPPPSKKVIQKLAEVLNTNEDELLISAGKVPTDIAEILKDRKTLEQLRAKREKKDAAITVKRLVSAPLAYVYIVIFSRI